MWIYEKKLEYPVKIKSKDLKMAKFLVTQYGGPDGELSAAIRYLNQRYTMPTGKTKGLLTDIGTEELAHVEIICAMIYQLTKDATPDELREAGLGAHYAQHDNALFPSDASGVPWTAAYIQALGDPVTDIHEDMAAEQKARATYEHLIDLTDDQDVKDVLKFLWAREIVHYQRFGEALVDVYDYIDSKKFF
ncbi:MULTISPECIES: manganese catalase family protein [Clostridiaceae]|uniref:manganese catalase family protein n=1 Tax=Clostridiaceae TaxID=31979 RepID=UPI00054FA046|nr:MULTISPECIES: manganese catalase family protein [Clostridiaceae]